MKILGIDPGIANTGYGLIEVISGEGDIRVKEKGVIITSPADDHGARLKKIYDKIEYILKQNIPDAVAIETIFYSKNLKSLVDVSETIGVITLAAYNFGIKVKKFTPLEVKSAVTGFGKARKTQVRLMVKQITGVDDINGPDHIFDAIAVAICYKNIYYL